MSHSYSSGSDSSSGAGYDSISDSLSDAIGHTGGTTIGHAATLSATRLGRPAALHGDPTPMECWATQVWHSARGGNSGSCSDNRATAPDLDVGRANSWSGNRSDETNSTTGDTTGSTITTGTRARATLFWSSAEEDHLDQCL